MANFFEDWMRQRRQSSPPASDGGGFNPLQALVTWLANLTAKAPIRFISPANRPAEMAKIKAERKRKYPDWNQDKETFDEYQARRGYRRAPEHALYGETWLTEGEPDPPSFNMGDLPMALMEVMGKGAEEWGKLTTWLPRKDRPPSETYEEFKASGRAPSVGLPWTSPFTGEKARMATPEVMEMLTPDIFFWGGKAPKAEQLVLKIIKNLEKGVDPEDVVKLLTTTTKAGVKYTEEDARNLLRTAQSSMKAGTKETVEFGMKGADIGVQKDIFGGGKIVRTTPTGAVEEILPTVSRGKGEQLGLGEKLPELPVSELPIRLLPPVEPGFIRLFRGGFAKEETESGLTGRWFAPSFETAKRYAGQLKEVKYIDVPVDVARQYIQKGANGELYYYLPKELAEQASSLGRIAEAAPKAIKPLVGKETTAFGADPSKTFKFRYKVVELEDLVASHTDILEPNPKFPAELQPRIRSREMSRVQIDEIAQNLEPDALLYDTRQLDTGPMIIGPDNIVESGSGRVLGLRKAVQQYPEKYADYLTKLKQQAKDLGFDIKKVEDMKNPVLVRERITNVPNRVAFVAEANVPVTMAMSPYEQAVQDAANLSDEVLSRLTVGEGQTIEQALKSSANRDVVYHFLQAIPDTVRAAISDAKGNINMAGLQRMKIAFLAKAFSGPSGRRLAEVFIESADPAVKNIENAVYKALPKLVKAEAISKTGFTEDVARAIEVFARLKAEGIKIPDYMAQKGMWGDELLPIQKMILAHFDDIGNRPKTLREFLSDLSDAILKISPKGQAAFGGEVERLSKEGIINAVITRQRKELKQEALNLATYTAKGEGLEEPIAGGVGAARTVEPPVPAGTRGITAIIPAEPVTAPVRKLADELVDLDVRLAASGSPVPQATRGAAGPPPKYPWQELPGETLAEAKVPPGAKPTPRVAERPSLYEGVPPLGQPTPTLRGPTPPRRPPPPPPGPPGAVPVNPAQAARNPGNWMQKTVQWWRLMEKRIIDDFARMNKMGTRAAKATGQPLFRGVSKLEESLALFRGMSGATRETIRQANVKIWNILDGEPRLLDDVGKYWEMRHQLEIMIHHGRLFYIRNVGGQGVTITSRQIMNELQIMERRLGTVGMRKVDDAAKVLVETYNQTLLKSHEITAQTARQLMGTYNYYCPSIYDDEVVKMVSRSSRMSPFTIRALSGDIEGVPRVLKGPLDTFAQTIATRMRINELNRVKKIAVETAMNDPELRGLVEITETMPKGAYIDFFENQTRKYMAIKEGAEWLAQDAQLLSVIPGPDTLSVFKNWGKALNYPARFGTTVASIPFIVANLVNDYVTAFIREGVGPLSVGKGWIRSIRSVFSEEDVVNAWRLAGAETAGFFGRSNDDVWRILTKQGNYVVKNPRDLKRIVLDVLHTTEMASRIAVFERGGEMAAFRARRVTIDFDRAGDVMKICNAWYLFLNAGKEGFMLPFRSIRDNPKGTVSRLSVLTGLVVGTYAWNRSNPAYERVPDSIKYGQTIIMLPSDKFDNSGKPVPKYIVVVPNMREWSIFTGPIVYLMRRLEGKNIAGLKETLKSWYPSWSPISNMIGASGGGLQVPTQFGQTMSEIAQNYDQYRAQPIVPDYLKEKPEVDQYDSRTSPMAIKIGKAFGWSPMMVDYAMSNFFGTLGRDVLNTMSQVVNAIDSDVQDPKIKAYVKELREINENTPPDMIESERVNFLNSLSPDIKDKVLRGERLPTDYVPLISGVLNRFYKNYPMGAPTPVYLTDQEAKLGTEIGGKIFTTDDLAWRYENKIKDTGRYALEETELGKFYLLSSDYIERSDYYDFKNPDDRVKLRKQDALLEAYMIFWGNLKQSENSQSMKWVREWMSTYGVPQNAIPGLQAKTGTVATPPSLVPERKKVPVPSNIYTPGYVPRTPTAPTPAVPGGTKENYRR